MNQSNHTPIRKEILVKAPQSRAFEVFTQKIDLWWPRSHKIGKSTMKKTVLEAKPGGRWYEIGDDQSECDWGKVLVWEPPNRLVLAWQISGKWQYDPSLVTEVEVQFKSEGENLTRVQLEHRNIERFGESAQPVRAAFESPEGWG